MVNLLGIYISILVASNVLLMAIILYDKFVLSRKKIEKISQQAFDMALTRVESQLQTSIDQFRTEIKDVIGQQHRVSDSVVDEIQKDLKTFHDEEVQKVQLFSKELYTLLLETTENVKKEMVGYIDQNKLKINEWRDSYIEYMKKASDTLLDEQKNALSTLSESSRSRVQTLVQELAEKEVALIVSEVLKNGISPKEQEQLVDEAITKYFGEAAK